MSHGKTITTFLMDGSLNGPRYIHSEDGRLRLFVLPREITTKLPTKEYPEYDTPCVYVLTGEDNGKKSYIGQSNAFKNRAVNHKTKKEFWDTAYVIVAKANTGFDANAINYLECKSIEEANLVGNDITSDNKTTPKLQNLPKHQIAPLEVYYEEAKMLLEFAGCGVFVKAEIHEGDIYYINAPMKGVAAKGEYIASTGEVKVLKDSVVDPKCAPSFRGKEKRMQMLAQLAEMKNGKLTLTKDIVFPSPSAASKFVLGRSSNGLTEWKKENGETLKERIGE
jgi:hypothetical protein